MLEKTVYHLGYRGGSGGFLLLHLLLLSDNFFCSFSEQKQFDQILKDQWNITDHKLWKQHEHWPDNFITANSNSSLNKILFECNPSVDDFFRYNKLFQRFNQAYLDVKEPSWPNITSFVDFDQLPQRIKSEVIDVLDCENLIQVALSGSTHKKSIWLYTDIHSQNELAFYKKASFYYQRPDREKIKNFADKSKKWQNTLVDIDAIYFLNNSNIQIKLQDLVNDPKILITHGLIDSINQNQYRLLTRWKNLHPPELLKKIGIEM
jgi:hypothetical protein